ncbi:Ig-like domain-containing protein [Hymenobacter fodinae]|uniref:SGNH/GDSL hydrolase family protein n=1 Tax=Hymenobacter fodinae TaxID=2510796 RepID=A0A4Z0P7A9_9BACT|nr:Ig-like domain-containing protein [Hymenobacter fodinae]TGE08262.1 SGNH/GDSL hydrolase family protein [Hymenobacter fodinae]
MPPNSLGADTDVYLNKETGYLYQKKAGSWAFLLPTKGADGKSAYQIWLDQGNVGTAAQFLATLNGEDGDDGERGDQWLRVTAKPADTVGQNDDYAFESITSKTYRIWHKVNGTWQLLVDLSTEATPVVTNPTPTPTNAAPVATFLSPSSGATVQKDVALQLTAQATDDVAVTKVEFYTGAGTLIGEGAKNGTSYSIPYTPTVAGQLQLQARAYDAAGLIGTATITITVQAASVPLSVEVSSEPPSSSVAGKAVNFGYTASGGKAPYQHAVKVTRESDQQVSTIGSASTPTYNTVWTPVTPGTYLLTDTVTDDAGAQKISAVRSITITSAPVDVPQTSLVLSSTYFTQNSYDQDNSAVAPNLRRRSALATSVPFNISGATAVKITQVVRQNDSSTQASTGYATVNGAQKTYFDNGGALVKVHTVPMPDLGTHVLRLFEGSAQRPYEEGDVLTGGSFTFLELVGSNASFTPAANVATASAVYVDGDSISVSAGAPRVDRGWLPRLREMMNCDIIAGGYGWRGLTKSLGTSELRQANLQLIKKAFEGRTGRRIYVIDLGTNDAGIGYGTAAQTAAAASDMAQLVYGWDSSVEVWIKTPIFRPDKNLADYTSALLNLKNTLPWLRTIDASSWLTQADLSSDLLHPSEAGAGIMASRYFAALNSQANDVAANYTQRVALNPTVQSAEVDGSYIIMRDSQDYNFQDFTLIVRLTLKSLHQYQQLAAKAIVNGVNGEGAFGLFTQDNGRISGGPFGAGSSLLVSDTSLGVGTSFMAAIVSTRSETRLHINGEVKRGAPVSVVGSIQDGITFGAVRKINAASATGNALNGFFERASYFNTGLDEATIASIFAANGVLTQAQYEADNCLLETEFKIKPGGTVMYNKADPERNLDLVLRAGDTANAPA